MDRGRPEQLGQFVRTVLSIEPKLEVHTNAVELARAEVGSAIVLVPDVAQAKWLNQERPVLASRRLRVLLYCDAATSAELARRAPDFFHWISTYIEAPQGAWPPAVRGLRAAAVRGTGVAWMGGNFEEAFGEAFPEAEIARRSAAMPYAEMVEAFQKEEGWIGLTEVDGPFRMRRVQWAMAESGRRGKVVLLEPEVPPPGFWAVHGKVMPLKGAVERLQTAGAKHAARVAALLDCDARVVEDSASLLAAGVDEGTLLALTQDEDAGLAISRLMGERGLTESAPARPTSNDEVDNLAEAIARRRWSGAAAEALQRGDADVAERWSMLALAAGESQAANLTTLGLVMAQKGKLDEAERHLQNALRLLANSPEEQGVALPTLLEVISFVQKLRGNLKGARQTIEQALHEWKSVPDREQQLDYAFLLERLGEILEDQHDLDGAQRNLEKAVRIAENEHDDFANRIIADAAHELGVVLTTRGELGKARTSIEKALRIRQALHGAEHPSVSASLNRLGHILLGQVDIDGAERALRESLRVDQVLGNMETPQAVVSLTMLAQALLLKGDIAGARQTSAKALEIIAKHGGGKARSLKAATLHQLAAVNIAEGDLHEARENLEQALASMPDGEQLDRIASTEMELGMVLLSLRERNRGLALLRKAHRTFHRKLGPDHPLTKQAEALLSRVAPPSKP